MLELGGWLQENSTKAYPNVLGRARDSMEQVAQYGDTNFSTDYGYIPGLQEGDPGELVLAYFNRPTRWIWHGPPRSIFNDKAWIVIPVDFGMGLNRKDRKIIRPGEQSETLTTSEFRDRLQKTLDFLRANNRPYWQEVVVEQNRFLSAITNFDSR